MSADCNGNVLVRVRCSFEFKAPVVTENSKEEFLLLVGCCSAYYFVYTAVHFFRYNLNIVNKVEEINLY